MLSSKKQLIEKQKELKRRLLESYGNRPPTSDTEIAEAIENARQRESNDFKK